MYFDENNIQYVDKYYITRRTFSKFNSKQNENIRLVTYLNIFHEKKKKRKILMMFLLNGVTYGLTR